MTTNNDFDRKEDYDFNIYCPDNSSVSLTAYQQYYTLDSDGDPILNINTDIYFTIRFDRQLDKEEFDFLVCEDTSDTSKDFTELDEWVGLSEIVGPNTPVRILEFLQNLPEYEPQLAENSDYEVEEDYSALFETSN